MARKHEITVTVRVDNDPSCDTFVYSRSHKLSTAEYTQQAVGNLIKMVQGEHRALMPHNHRLPTFQPTTVEIKEVEA